VSRHERGEIEQLRARLEEAEETLRALRSGEIDALVVEGPGGPQVFTLTGAEQSYRLLVERMQEGALLLGTDGNVLYANQRFAEMVGTGLDEVIAQPLERFVAPEARSTLAALVRGDGGKEEMVMHAADGRAVPVYVSLSPLAADALHGLCVVVTDLTEQKRSEQLAAAGREKDEFLALLGHELRNPLSALRSASKVLDTPDVAEERAAAAREIIARQSAHLNRLVDDLLDVARLNTGKLTLVREPLDLARVVERACAALRESGESAARELTVRVDPAWVDGDGVRLDQIVTNIVGNALKYTNPGDAIRVSLAVEGDDAVLRVEDTGLGIPPALLGRVFRVFVQGEYAAGHARGGLGIGLSLVARLVELHGGSIDAESPGLGRGSTFTVRLPRVAPASSVAPASAPAPAARAPRRVLVADDNDDSREIMRALLELNGHEVHEVSDGLSAVEAVHDLRLDVALIDIGMPGIDGYEVARRIRRLGTTPRPTLIALTGYGQADDRRRGLDAGFDRYIVKPLDPDLLEDIVQGRLASESSRRYG
jgi:PAS domain S-box-containing protein